MKEIIKDYPDYEIHCDGRVYSLPRVMTDKLGRTRRVGGSFLKQHICGGGYMKVNLFNNSGSKSHAVHRLVAAAFLGHTPDGYDIVVHHEDDDKLNNNVDNLRLISSGENVHLGFKLKDISSQLRGVSETPNGRWRSDFRHKYYGTYDTPQEAHAAIKHLH